jgi:hypothetical protein
LEEEIPSNSPVNLLLVVGKACGTPDTETPLMTANLPNPKRKAIGISQQSPGQHPSNDGVVAKKMSTKFVIYTPTKLTEKQDEEQDKEFH